MRKCKGCGAYLQDSDPSKIGYVVDLEKDYCQRCFRLTHYGDVSNLKSNFVSNEKIIDIYNKYHGFLFCLIIDALEAFALKDDDLLDLFRNEDLVIVINKTDVLPENMSYAKLERIFTDILISLNRRYPNIKAAILSNVHETAFNEKIMKIFDELGTKKILFAGRANAGKSSLINKLLGNRSLTTSIYPGTTLQEVEVSYQDYLFIDTPGLVDVGSYASYLNAQSYKLTKLTRTIKAQVFQLSEPQSYFYEGLLRADIKPEGKASISFYVNQDNRIHRTAYDNADAYYEKHYSDFRLKLKPLARHTYQVSERKLLLIKGIGLLKITGRCNVDLYVYEHVKIFECEDYI